MNDSPFEFRLGHTFTPTDLEIHVLEEKPQVVEQAAAAIEGSRRRRYSRFILAALGTIPWVGGVMGATAAADAESEQQQVNQLLRDWLTEHHEKIRKLGATVNWILTRLEQFGEEADKRLEEDDYFDVVRKGFRAWDHADTEEKRQMVARLIAHAGGTKLCSDDVVRLFIDWLNLYHEAHFQVVRVIHRRPGATRFDIWTDIHGKVVRENSAEADLFKLLMRDLSTGSVIRQRRETTWDGRFVKKTAGRGKDTSTRVGTGSSLMKSAFDREEPYELTELGRQFVHYTMEEPVPRIPESL